MQAFDFKRSRAFLALANEVGLAATTIGACCHDTQHMILKQTTSETNSRWRIEARSGRLRHILKPECTVQWPECAVHGALWRSPTRRVACDESLSCSVQIQNITSSNICRNHANARPRRCLQCHFPPMPQRHFATVIQQSFCADGRINNHTIVGARAMASH